MKKYRQTIIALAASLNTMIQLVKTKYGNQFEDINTEIELAHKHIKEAREFTIWNNIKEVSPKHNGFYIVAYDIGKPNSNYVQPMEYKDGEWLEHSDEGIEGILKASDQYYLTAWTPYPNYFGDNQIDTL